MLGNVYDPGLREGRELLSIPVTGFTENSVLFARMVADTAAIVTLEDNPSHTCAKRSILRSGRSGVPPQCKHSVDSVARAFTDDDLQSDVVADLLDAARECIDDAELVIPGANILSMLLNEEDVYEVASVPITDGVTTLVKTTETLVDLYEVNALATSKRRMYQPPDDETLDELIDTYLPDP